MKNKKLFGDGGEEGTGTCPNLKNQRFAYLFPHPVLSWEDCVEGLAMGNFAVSCIDQG